MKIYRLKSIIIIFTNFFMFTMAYADQPVWTFEPLTSTNLAVPANSTALIQYRVTNQSRKNHVLTMNPIQGIVQITTGVGRCGNPFILTGNNSCILTMQVIGSQLTGPILGGPIVCQVGGGQCYQPNAANSLRITQAAPITNAVVNVVNSPLTLAVNGLPGQLIIYNTTTEVAATNVTANFTGTALAGRVTETGNTCAIVPPGGSCTLTFTPGNTVVPLTNFTIQGSNTNAITAAIAIQSGSTLTSITPNSGSAAGGTSVTLTGTALTGATNVTFGGVAAVAINVVNSTTITAVTPAHTVGIVDVVVDTPAGGGILANGYTYLTPIPGQLAAGGIIGCTNGGLNNLIVATTNNNPSVQWGGFGIVTNAQSDTDGAANTALIVAVLGNNGGVSYSAQVCNDYEVDSQGNSPCATGICYADWFLPSKNQLNCLNTNQVAIGGFTGGGSAYTSSTEVSSLPTFDNWVQAFPGGFQNEGTKDFFGITRCVRSF